MMGMATIRCISEQLWGIPWNEHWCEAFIRIEWVLIRIAMNRSSGYNSLFCPAILAELRCLKSTASRTQGSVSRMRADPGCFAIPNFHLIFRTQPKHVLWFVELAYRACMPRCSHPRCKHGSAVIQRRYRTCDVIIDCNGVYEHSQLVLEVSTFLGDVMGSRNSKSIEQRWSDSGCRLGWRSRV